MLAIAFLTQKHDQTECRDGGPNHYQPCTFENVLVTSVSSIHGIQAPQRNPNPERNEWREESDLYAQWSMVWWAKVSAIIAAMGLFITAVGIILVKQTLDANRAAVAAANRANESQREIGEAQVRAYLTISKVVGTFKDGDLFMQFTLSNSGNSPATNVELPFEVADGWGSASHVNDVSQWDLLVLGSLRSGGEHVETFRTRFSSASATGKFTKLIKIRVVVTYTDVFGHGHVEPIAFQGGFPIDCDGTTMIFDTLSHERFPWLDQQFIV